MYTFQFLIGFGFVSFLYGFSRVFNRSAPCNTLSKLLELSLCSLIFDLLLFFNLSMINPSLQPLPKLSPSLSIEMLLLSSSLPESEL